MTNLRHEDQSPKDLLPTAFVLGIVAIVVVMSTMVWPVWNLLPQYVTEQVKVVAVDPTGTWADTHDNYLVRLSGSYNNVHPGQYIMGTYDVKVKDRMNTYG